MSPGSCSLLMGIGSTDRGLLFKVVIQATMYLGLNPGSLCCWAIVLPTHWTTAADISIDTTIPCTWQIVFNQCEKGKTVVKVKVYRLFHHFFLHVTFEISVQPAAFVEF